MFDLSERPWELPSHVPFAAQGNGPTVAAPTPASGDLDMLRLGAKGLENFLCGDVLSLSKLWRDRCLCRLPGAGAHAAILPAANWRAGVRMLGPHAVWSWLMNLAPSRHSGAAGVLRRGSAAGGGALIPVNAAPAAYGPVHSTGQPYEFCHGAGVLPPRR